MKTRLQPEQNAAVYIHQMDKNDKMMKFIIIFAVILIVSVASAFAIG